MACLLADVNVQGHLRYLRQLMHSLGLLEILTEYQITMLTFPDLNLDRHMNDRDLWIYCQANELVLFTENRNNNGENSLSATIQDSWQDGHLKV